MSRFRWIIVLVGLVNINGCNKSTPDVESVTEPTVEMAADPVAAARELMNRRDFAGAGERIQALLIDQPTNPAVLELAADLSIQRGHTDRAIEFLRLAIDSSDKPSSSTLDKLGQQFMNAGKPFDALDAAVLSVEHSPQDPVLRQKLVGLQASLGMQRDSADHLRWLVQRGSGNVNLLIILSDLNRPQTVEATCQYALKKNPDDLRPQYSLACLPAYHGKWSEVTEKLASVIDQHPQFVPAQALYGRGVVELGDVEAIEKWFASLRGDVQQDPQYWMAAGILADQQNQPERAAHAFWRAALLNEDDAEALSRLSVNLARIGRTDESKLAAQRAGKLTVLRDQVDSLLALRNNSQSAALRIAITLKELGRLWEATTWLQAAFAMTQNVAPNLTETYKSIRSELTAETPWQSPDKLVAMNLDLSDLPGIDAPLEIVRTQSSSNDQSSVGFRFADEAARRNLRHVCAIGKPSGEEADLAIYQSGAGGAGVIDFDLDGWPDVYLTVIDGEPKAINSRPNRFFRNIEGQFVELTSQVGVGDRGFSQGIAVGDYNSDGLPDLWVANIGANRLYRNNGDGTFTDATTQAGLRGNQWTTSGAIADLDGDGHADLFEVQYCAGDKPLTQQCMDQKLNQARSCSPLAFDAERDRVWRGVGDGSFTEATDAWFDRHEGGRGFGLIVGQLDGESGLDVYVANDMTGNHYWSRHEDHENAFRLSDQATIRGLAVNARSLSQASMGMAAGDADGDGDVDFLLTHFSGDHNTYYEQVSPGMWADRSQQVGLAAPSDRMLGYGTQWIDAENDGSPELFIANGDIDDFTHENRRFRQPVQFFDRAGDGRWVEVRRDLMGEYFTRDHLARSVVTLDADRDGRSDLLVTHLFDPVALLINQTKTDLHQVRFFLKATRSHRDAIGAKIELQADGRRLVGQLFAGDGFQCSNERCVTFGTGASRQFNDVKITWPDGTVEKLGSLDAGNDYLVIQGAEDGFALER